MRSSVGDTVKPNNKELLKLYEKLSFNHNGQKFDLKSLIGNGIRFTDLLKKIDGNIKVDGSDPEYTRIYRRVHFLSRKKLFTIEKKTHVDWSATTKQRELEIEQSVHTIFDDAIKGTVPFVSSGTPTADQVSPVSTVKIHENGFHVIPTGQLLYLFSQVQNSNLVKKCANKPPVKWMDRIYRIPSKCAKGRVSAIKTLMDVRSRSLFQRDLTCPKCKGTGHQIPGKKIAECNKCGMSWKPPIQPALKKELNEVRYKFDDWESDTLNKELFFDRGPGSQIVKMPCRTRFTDKGRKVHNVKTYDRAWSRANLLFQRGVFLTLTTDPSLHPSLWHANRHIAIAFNKYISLLVSRKKRNMKKGYDTESDQHDQVDQGTGRLKYISAAEYQENGLIHLHLVFFGIRYLAKIDEISDDWVKCGQGRIVHAYSIRRDGDQWLWNKEKPSDSQGKDPVGYLRKYLEKALYVNDSFSMYWVMNKRFSTMSRLFQTKECAGCRSVWGSQLKWCPDCGGPLFHVPQGFRFLGSLEIGYSPTAGMMDRNRSASPFDALGGLVPA